MKRYVRKFEETKNVIQRMLQQGIESIIMQYNKDQHRMIDKIIDYVESDRQSSLSGKEKDKMRNIIDNTFDAHLSGATKLDRKMIKVISKDLFEELIGE